MRSLVRLIAEDNAAIPINYQHALSSALYRFIKEANPDLSSSLHHSQDFKFFNFSNIRFPKPVMKGSEVHIRKGGASFFNFSSPAGDILEATLNGMLSTGRMELLGAVFIIEKIEILSTPDFSPLPVFRTLSPVYIDMVREGGRRWDLMPTDPEWRERLEENSRKKYSHYFGREYKGNFEIGEIKRFSSKRINISGQWWRAAHVHFALNASPDMLGFLWDTGMGSRNSQGFGCLQYLDANGSAEPPSSGVSPAEKG